MQIRPYGLMTYERVEYPTRRPKGKHHWQPGLMEISQPTDFDRQTGQAQYKGDLSPGAKKRLKRAIQLILAIAEPKTAMNWKMNKEFKFKLNFITLTLPGMQGDITDKSIKSKVLDVWLKSAKRRFKLRSYIWRAERQKNGNLHFHLVTDTYIPYDQLRDTWNVRLNALGFIDRFEKKHGHRHPNSTDVHAIHNVKNLAGYFSKYMAKDAKKDQPIDGKVWDCSRNLKHKSNCETFLEGQALDIWNKAMNDTTLNSKSTEYCHIIFLNLTQFDSYVTGVLRSEYDSWLNVIRNIPDDQSKKPPEKTACPF